MEILPLKNKQERTEAREGVSAHLSPALEPRELACLRHAVLGRKELL